VLLLLEELYTNYTDFKKSKIPTGAARELLVEILDVDGDGLITADDFLFFLEVTRIRLSQVQSNTFMDVFFPNVVKSYGFQQLKRIIEYKYYNVVFDTALSIAIPLNLALNTDDAYHPTKSSIAVSFSLINLLILEAMVKITVRGFTNYRRSFRNKVDLFIAGTALIAEICASTYSDVDSVNGFTVIMRILLMMKLFLYPRNLRYFFEGKKGTMKRFARLLRRIFAKTVTLGIVFICVAYFFNSIAMVSYGGLIDKSPVHNSQYNDLMYSPYGVQNFFGLNFNDFTSGMITLFACLHVSDFDTIASGFTSTTNDAAKLFFTMWYVVGVLLMLNILKSFFLGEFLSLFLVSPTEAGAGAATKTENNEGNDDFDDHDHDHQLNEAFGDDGGGDRESGVDNPLRPTIISNRDTYVVQSSNHLHNNSQHHQQQQQQPAASGPAPSAAPPVRGLSRGLSSHNSSLHNVHNSTNLSSNHSSNHNSNHNSRQASLEASSLSSLSIHHVTNPIDVDEYKNVALATHTSKTGGKFIMLLLGIAVLYLLLVVNLIVFFSLHRFASNEAQSCADAQYFASTARVKVRKISITIIEIIGVFLGGFFYSFVP
jgi:hypothetical protein